MKIIHKHFLPFFLFAIILVSCSTDSNEPENNPIDPVGETGGDTFKQEIFMTIIKDGVESEIKIDEFIGASVNLDEQNGYSFKKIEITTGWENTFPQIDAEFPFKVGSYEFGTTYGEDNDFLDFFSLKLSNDDYFRENTEYADIIDVQWIQPWLEVLSIEAGSEGEYDMEAIFGGTLIFYEYGSGADTASAVTIKTGTMKISVPDDYPDVTDNSASIANPPTVGGATGGGGQDNIYADFDIRFPGSYISGTQMLFDTATLEIVNKSSGAITLEFELTSGDYWYSDNYFFETTQIGIGSFHKTMRLYNVLDTNSFTVKLTAYDEHGNSKTAFKSVDLPILRCQMFINGQLVDDPGIICYEEYESNNNSQYEVFGIAFEDIDTFHFGDAGYFPEPGNILDDIGQTGSWFIPRNDYSFYLEKSYPNGGITFDDPDANYSSLTLDNYSIQVVNNSIHKIFGSVYAEYTLNDPTGPTGTVEFRYLAPYSKFYSFKNHKEKELYEGKINAK